MRRFDHGGDIYRNQVRLDFSVNTNPLGMPPLIKDALIENMDACSLYPDPNCGKLTQAIAEYENVPGNSVLCGNGAADIIYRLVFSQKPKRVLVCAPTFSEYERAVLISGGSVKYHYLSEQDEFRLTERFLDDITPETNMVFVCNPNNPTGKLADFALLEAMAEKCESVGALMVSDECFLPFTTEGKSLKKKPCVAVIKAFTKLYSMAGLRLGYLLCGNGEVLGRARDYAQTWSVSAPAQIAGLAALSCTEFTERTALTVKTERGFLSEEFSKLGFYVYDSDANFLLIRSERPLYEALLTRGILTRRCGNFVGLDDSFMRVAVKTHDENIELIKAIREILYG